MEPCTSSPQAKNNAGHLREVTTLAEEPAMMLGRLQRSMSQGEQAASVE